MKFPRPLTAAAAHLDGATGISFTDENGRSAFFIFEPSGLLRAEERAAAMNDAGGFLTGFGLTSREKILVL